MNRSKLIQQISVVLLFAMSLLISQTSQASLLPFEQPLTVDQGGWQIDPNHPPVKVKFALTGQHDIQQGTVNALLQVRLDGDWKTYWRSPGEGGTGPQFNWKDSHNIASINWQWPTPKRYPVLGVETLGYK